MSAGPQHHETCATPFTIFVSAATEPATPRDLQFAGTLNRTAAFPTGRTCAVIVPKHVTTPAVEVGLRFC
jgi:hypothetical protein